MKLVMTIFKTDGTIHKTHALRVSNNDLSRLNGPGLFGKNLYLLKKKKEVEIGFPDGRVRYALVNE